MLLTGILALAPTLSYAEDFNFYVDPTLGSDLPGCGKQADPCNSLGYAVTYIASSGDSLRLLGNADFSVQGVNINYDLSIHGTGETVLDAGNINRHFHIDGATVLLQDMVLKNGKINDHGGSIRVTGGDLKLRNVKLENNKATSGGALSISDSTLLSENSEYNDNRATIHDGGAISCSGSSMELFDSIFTDNSADEGDGGAIDSRCATDIRRSDFINNHAENNGGGISFDVGVDSALGIRRSQFSYNTAESGGAIRVIEGALEVRRSSFVENAATDYDGGRILASDLTVINSTFSKNSAARDAGAVFAVYASLYFVTMVDNYSLDPDRAQDTFTTRSMNINNSMIHHDPSTILNDTLLCGGLDIYYSGVGNLVDNDTCGTNIGKVGSHNYGALDKLGSHGGRTESYGLLGISNALDAATGCQGANGLLTLDQRGSPRPESVNSLCNIGSFELE